MNMKFALIGIAVIIVGFLLSDSFFTVRQAQQALVLQFGDHRRTVQDDPGLHMKLPFVQDVVYYEARVLTVDPPVEQVILADQRRLDVDSFALYRISNPLQFYQSITTEVIAEQRISTFVNAALRSVLGNRLQVEVLSEERANIMNDIRRRVATEAEPFGMEIIDVRIGRADVPEGTRQSVFQRMRSEREREASEFRAQGEEQAQQIRARADRERTVLIAEADRRSQILRGQGDGRAIEIQAEAHNLDPEFFSFFRSLQAYRTGIATEEATLVLPPTGEFFRYFRDISGGQGQLPSRGDPTDLTETIRNMLVSPDEAGDGLGLVPQVDTSPIELPEGGSALPPPLEEVEPNLFDDGSATPPPPPAGGEGGEDAAGGGEAAAGAAPAEPLDEAAE